MPKIRVVDVKLVESGRYEVKEVKDLFCQKKWKIYLFILSLFIINLIQNAFRLLCVNLK